MKSQKQLLMDLFQEKHFIVIVLDSCRPDSLKRWISKNRPNLMKYLSTVESEGKTTDEWFINTFSERFFDLTYISAHPFINSTGVTPVGKIAKEHLKRVIDAWRDWDAREQVCLPQVVNKHAMTNITEPRLMVHYLQPHQPYIGLVRIPRSWYGSEHFFPRSRPRIRQIRARSFSLYQAQIIKEAYESNVDLVCSFAFRIIDRRSGGFIVVTADHSEMMGENGQWFHDQKPRPDTLKCVPWLFFSKNFM